MPKFAVVTAIESGVLEAQFMRMVASWRRHAGAMADCEIIAVTSRFGPRLHPDTYEAMHKFDVRYIKRGSHPAYAWFHYLNKLIAIQEAEKVTAAEQIAFLDCDTLIIREPKMLLLRDNEDFVAAPSDEGVVGSIGPESVHDQSWRNICKVLELDIDKLPWVTTYLEQKRIRLYWNAGIYVYRRSTGFSNAYYDACLKILQREEGFGCNGEHSLDQVILGLVVAKLGMRWRHLEESHNYPVASFLPNQFTRSGYSDACILHYHDSQRKEFWETFLSHLQEHHPQAAQWLSQLGPLENPASKMSRKISEVLRILRGIKRKRYRSAVKQKYPLQTS